MKAFSQTYNNFIDSVDPNEKGLWNEILLLASKELKTPVDELYLEQAGLNTDLETFIQNAKVIKVITEVKDLTGKVVSKEFIIEVKGVKFVVIFDLDQYIVISKSEWNSKTKTFSEVEEVEEKDEVKEVDEETSEISETKFSEKNYEQFHKDWMKAHGTVTTPTNWKLRAKEVLDFLIKYDFEVPSDEFKTRDEFESIRLKLERVVDAKDTIKTYDELHKAIEDSLKDDLKLSSKNTKRIYSDSDLETFATKGVKATDDNIKQLVAEAIEKFGNQADLNFIDVSEVTDLYNLFANSNFNGDISKWNTSKVETMEETFASSDFNGDISKWNVSNVKDMSRMFRFSSFNGDVSKWDVSNVEDMSSMFAFSKFNKDISKWNVSSVKTLNYMFYNSSPFKGFNGDISKWKVSNVKSMRYMFYNSDFNGDISNWDVSNVKDMSYMFYNSDFNGDISKWNTSKVENMSYMFYNSVFNGDISKWNTSKVENMSYLFYKSKFNGDISKWNTSKVETMEGMFHSSDFNGDISKWNTSKVKSAEDMFKDCPIKDEFKPKGLDKLSPYGNSRFSEIADLFSKIKDLQIDGTNLLVEILAKYNCKLKPEDAAEVFGEIFNFLSSKKSFSETIENLKTKHPEFTKLDSLLRSNLQHLKADNLNSLIVCWSNEYTGETLDKFNKFIDSLKLEKDLDFKEFDDKPVSTSLKTDGEDYYIVIVGPSDSFYGGKLLISLEHWDNTSKFSKTETNTDMTEEHFTNFQSDLLELVKLSETLTPETFNEVISELKDFYEKYDLKLELPTKIESLKALLTLMQQLPKSTDNMSLPVEKYYETMVKAISSKKVFSMTFDEYIKEYDDDSKEIESYLKNIAEILNTDSKLLLIASAHKSPKLNKSKVPFEKYKQFINGLKTKELIDDVKTGLKHTITLKEDDKGNKYHVFETKDDTAIVIISNSPELKNFSDTVFKIYRDTFNNSADAFVVRDNEVKRITIVDGKVNNVRVCKMHTPEDFESLPFDEDYHNNIVKLLNESGITKFSDLYSFDLSKVNFEECFNNYYNKVDETWKKALETHKDNLISTLQKLTKLVKEEDLRLLSEEKESDNVNKQLDFLKITSLAPMVKDLLVECYKLAKTPDEITEDETATDTYTLKNLMKKRFAEDEIEVKEVSDNEIEAKVNDTTFSIKCKGNTFSVRVNKSVGLFAEGEELEIEVDTDEDIDEAYKVMCDTLKGTGTYSSPKYIERLKRSIERQKSLIKRGLGNPKTLKNLEDHLAKANKKSTSQTKTYSDSSSVEVFERLIGKK